MGAADRSPQPGSAYRGLALCGVAALLAWMVVDWYPEYQESRRMDARRTAIERSMGDLERANRVLVAQIQALDTTRGMELALRDRGYIRQGEVSLSADGPRGRYVPAAEPSRHPKTVAESVSRWVEHGLNALTGREAQAGEAPKRVLPARLPDVDG